MSRRPLKPTCPKCNGQGRVSLADIHPSLDQTLELLASFKRPATAPEVYEKTPADRRGTSVTSINNQLEDLRSMGFVSRMRAGKAWQYFVIRKSK